MIIDTRNPEQDIYATVRILPFASNSCRPLSAQQCSRHHDNAAPPLRQARLPVVTATASVSCPRIFSRRLLRCLVPASLTMGKSLTFDSHSGWRCYKPLKKHSLLVATSHSFSRKSRPNLPRCLHDDQYI